MYANDEVRSRNEKLNGRFNLMINPKLPIQTQINKFVTEPIAFHLHKNRLFLDKMAKKEKPQMSTRDILSKIDKEMKVVDSRVEKAMQKREKLYIKQGRSENLNKSSPN